MRNYYTNDTPMGRKLETVLLLLLASGIALSLAAHVFAVFPFDLKVTHEMQEEDNPVFASVMAAVSSLGDGWIPVILVGSVTALCVLRKKYLEAVFVVATLSSVLLAAVLKVLVGRPRPPSFSLNPTDFFPAFNQYSYPSGHVLFFVVFFGFLAFLAWMHLSGWLRVISIAVCSALIVLIAPSRIYLGAHWASDVIGSYLIGTFWLIILVLLYLVVLHHRDGVPAVSPEHG
jgi:membrane-associated phospholipid phosphatase